MNINRIRDGLFAASMVLAGNASAIPAQAPLFLTKNVSPMVLLTMSVDHQLFNKAFADYSDLNSDGIIDNSYVDSFSYYGYFDSKRCYEYVGTGNEGYFSPGNAAIGPNGHHCGGEWSGNFLNWATMTRIDVLRKALYGGKRAIDDADKTILERALLANDVHSFAKVFTPGPDDSTANYTPYSQTTITMCNSTPQPTSGYDETQLMDTAVNPPKMRIVKGDWGRWAAGERNQCEFYENAKEANRDAGIVPGYELNLFGTGTSAAPNVKVAVCVKDKLEANCRSYDDANAKPTGLLQEYGEDGLVRFGLLSGSYAKRDKGGVLRKGISQIAGNATASDDEINLADGTFNSAVNGIISTLDKVRLNTWDYGDTHYNDCDTYSISVETYLTSTAANRQCSNWGNPVSEMYLEAVRYLTGESSPTTTFNVAADALGLPTAGWVDPMPATDWCTPMSVVLLSSGDNTFDTDHLSGAPGVLGSISAATDAIGGREGFSGDVFIGDNGKLSSYVNTCSAKEFTTLSQMRGLCPSSPNKQGGYAVAGLAHKAHTVDLRTDRQNDPVTGDGQTISTYAVAMAKNLPDFILPLGNSELTLVPVAFAGSSSTPPVDSPDWTPASLAQLSIENQEYANGELVYLRLLAQWEDSAWGSDYDMDMVSRVSVCVAEHCTTHDDDGDGANDTSPGSGVARVTVRMMHAEGGVSMKVGFVVSGTSADGPYAEVVKGTYTNGNANFSSFNDDPLKDANEPKPASYTFSAGASTARNLPSPLQLAAKYGAFKDSNDNGLPDLASEWDEDADGIADSFFFADDPSQIGPKLASYLSTIATTSSASAVVANSVSFQSTTRIYQARFDSKDWTGQLLSFPLDVATGAVLDPEWDAGQRMSAQYHGALKFGARQVLTWDPATGAGVPFLWDDLNPTQQGLLRLNPSSGSADGNGEKRLDYLRGDDSLEQSNGGLFRDRPSLLGDNVNSSPAVVGTPRYGYLDAIESVPYSGFVEQYEDVECYDAEGNLRPVGDLDREPMVYFGANDGMLHGVSACTGQERIAYVPNAVIADLPKLTSPNYSHHYYVDGSPTIVDAFFDSESAWRTVLVGSTRAGGRSVFALDITNPGDFAGDSATDVVLWEISKTSGGAFDDLGYTFSQPAVVKTLQDGWVAAFGNGYDSDSGRAVLYLVDIETGAQVEKVVLHAGPNNGLSTVAPVDIDGDGLADLIYAGDLLGNVWRVDVSRNTVTSSRLYQARDAANNPQPITSRVEVGRHPTSAKGRLVYFGTGKYYQTMDGDPAQSGANSMYGVWDRDTGTTVTSVVTRNSNLLQQQTVLDQRAEDFDGNVYDIRVLSDRAVTWLPADAKGGLGCGSLNPSRTADLADGDDYLQCGWYLDLPDYGEKMVSNPILRGGRLIFVTTIPSLSACDAGGSGWLMEIAAENGGRVDRPVFDLNGDGVFDYDDMDTEVVEGAATPISGKKSKVGILQPPAIVAGVGGEGTGGYGKAEAKYASGSDGGKIEVTIEDVGLPSQGRKSWLQLK